MANGKNPISYADIFDLSDDKVIVNFIKSVQKINGEVEKLITAFDGLAKSQRDSLQRATKDIIDYTKSLSTASSEGKKALLSIADAVDDLKKRQASQVDTEKALDKVRKDANKSIDNLAKGIKALTENIKSMAKANGNSVSMEKQLAKLRDDQQKQTDKLIKQISDLKDKQKQLVDSQKQQVQTNKDSAKQLKDSQKDIDSLQKKLESLKKAYDALRNSQSNAGSSNQSQNSPAKSMKGLEDAIKSLIIQYKQLDSANDKDVEAMKIISKQIRDLKAEYNALAKDTKVSANTISTATNYYKEMEDKVKALTRRLHEMPDAFKPVTDETKQLIADIREGNKQLRDFDKQLGINSRNVGNYAEGFSAVAEGVLGFSSPMGAAILAITTLIQGIISAINANVEFEDSLTDVQRTAQLTRTEAELLTEALKELDTRTTLAGLVDIAKIGGSLGIAKDELVGFTSAIDKLAIVLDTEIQGGAEEVARSLGTINNVFKVAQKEGVGTETALLKTGSAILKLGQSGLATGGYLVDFTERIGGLSQVAKIALPDVLAYGAVLQESGISAEVGSTGLQSLLNEMAKSPKVFYQFASLADDSNMKLKDFTLLINTDAKKAFDLFLKGLGGSKTGFTDFAKAMKLTGVDGQRVLSVLSTLSRETDLIATRSKQATQALNDGTLAVEQFRLKNQNLGGVLSRIGNSMKEAFLESGFAQSLANGLDELVYNTSKTEEGIGALRAENINSKRVVDDLIETYTTLNNKMGDSKDISKLTKDEQAKLRDTINDLSRIVPSAVTEFNNLNQAMDISIEKVREYSIGLDKLIGISRVSAIKALREENVKFNENIANSKKIIEGTANAWDNFWSKGATSEIDKTRASTKAIIDNIIKIKEVYKEKLTPEESTMLESFKKIQELTSPKTVKTGKEGDIDPDVLALQEKIAKMEKEAEKAKKVKTAFEKLQETVNKFKLSIENQALAGNLSLATIGKYADATNRLNDAQEKANLVMQQAVAPFKALQVEHGLLTEKLAEQISKGEDVSKTLDKITVANEELKRVQDLTKLAIAETAGGLELLNTKLELSRQQFEKEAVQGNISNKTFSEFQKTTEDVAEAQVKLQRAVLQATDPMGLLNFEIEQLAGAMQKQVMQGGLSTETINKYADSLLKLNKVQERLKDAQNPFFAQDISVLQAETALAKITPGARKQFDAQGGGKQVEEARKIEQQVLQTRIDRINEEQNLYDTSYKRWYELELEKTQILAQQEENRTRITKEKQDKRNKIVEEGTQLLSGLLTGLNDIAKINADNELAYLEQKKNKELEIVGNNNDAKSAIEKKYAKQQAEIKRRQAENDKKLALFDIAIQTAIAVSKAVASSPLTFGLPWSAFALANGALQAGLVLAKPIPAYAKGTKNAPEGLAIVGERGTEAIESKDGSIRLTQDKAHLAYLQQGDIVHTADSKETRMYKDAISGISGGSKSSNAYSDAFESINSKKRKFEENKVSQMARQMQLSPETIATAMRKAIKDELVIERHTFDENGYSSFRNKKGLSVKQLNKRNTFG